MKITIEIDEEQIRQIVKELVIRNAVSTVEKKLFTDEYGYMDRRIYKEGIAGAVRDAVKAHSDDIIDRAVKYAGEYIGKKGLKKMIDEGSI